jgi:tight adherence protein B
MISFFVFFAFLLGTLGAYLLATRSSEVKKEKLRQRLNEALLYSSNISDDEIQLARMELMSEIPLLNQIMIRFQGATQLKKMLDQADLHITVTRLFMFAILSGLLAAMAASVITISLLFIALAGLVATSLPFVHVVWARNRRLKKFLEHLPDSLELMSRALAAGHSFPETLHMISQEMPEPIAGEFRKTYEEQNLGLSLKLALENLAERIPLLDLRLCVTAILIQKETGGNLAEILEKVSHTIRDRFRIMEDLATLTTSSRMSAWILCGLPVFVAITVTIMNPDYMSVLWTDPRGHRLIAIALGMQIVGMLVMQKILKIKI